MPSHARATKDKEVATSPSGHRPPSFTILALAGLALVSCYPMPVFDNPYDPKGINYIPSPAAPIGVVATAGNALVTVTWTAVTGATSYSIYYKAGTSAATTDTKVGSSAIAGTTATVTGLVNGTRYAFVVTAGNSMGASAASGVATATPTVGASLTMLPVAGGSFSNGTSTVTLGSFTMSKYEVTQAKYAAVTGDSPSSFTGDTSLPVEMVTWFDAVEFCNKLSDMEGLTSVYTITGRTPDTGYPITSATVTQDMAKTGYRLPTAAEWEYAARGGGSTNGYAYSGSDTIDDVAWYLSNSGNTTHPVGSKTANELGFFDMSGNVWELCQDWYGSYPSDAQTDPVGPASGTLRVYRGGGWLHEAATCTVSNRSYINPYDRRSDVGFRVARRSVTTTTTTTIAATTTTTTTLPVAVSPATPTSVVATVGDAQVTISWTAVLGATSYNVYYKAGTSAATSDTKVNSGSIVGTTATVTALTNGTQYAFVVAAVNSIGVSAVSVAVTATPSSSVNPAVQTLSVSAPSAAFTKYGTVALLSKGATGSWDAAWVSAPSVMNDGGTFKMWYSGIDASNVYRIGYATSADGYSWTKYGTSAVIAQGTSGQFDDGGVCWPSVIKEASTYKMWYTGMRAGSPMGIGYATSSDGISWTKYGTSPVLTSGTGWDAAWAGNGAVTKVGSTYHMYYTGYNFSGGNDRIGHATSTDGIAWTKDSANPVFDMDSTDAYGVLSPWVVYDGATWHMWYTGVSSAWYRIEYASSSTGTGASWTRGATRPVLSRDGTVPWDNFYIYYACPVVVNGKIWMYYGGEPSSRSPDAIGLAQMLN